MLAQVKDADIAEADARAVAAEADVAVLVEQAGMVLMVYGVGVALAAVGRYVVTLAGLADVTVEDHLAVDRHADVVALGVDLFRVPCAEFTEFDMLWNDDAIDRAVLLIGMKVGVDGVVVVEHLYLHAVVGCIGADVCAYADTVVYAGLDEGELEAVDEVAILLLGVQVSAAAVVGRDIDCAVVGGVVDGVALPLVEVVPVEEEFEALFLLLGR